jgi:LacI family transcriptional regulator
MNDVAQTAGVSVATVDRVLNRRAPVRQSTAERILKSAEELKYYATPLLRSQVQALRRPVRCAVLLHSGAMPFCQTLEANLRQSARTNPEIAADFKVVCGDDINSEHVADRIGALSRTVDALAVVAVDHPHVSLAIREAAERGVATIALISDLSSEEKYCYVGIDNRRAGRTAAWFLTRMVRRSGTLGLLIGSHRYLCQESREAGFRSYLREKASSFQMAEASVHLDNSAVAYEAAREFLERHPDCVGIYDVGGGEQGTLKALEEARTKRHIVFICHELVSHTREALIRGTADIVIDQDPRMLAEQCLKAMIASGDTSTVKIRSEAVPFAIYTSENL